MTDPIPSVDQLLDTTAMRRIRRRRDMLPDLAVCAACALLLACVIVAAVQSLTAGLGVLLLAILAVAALWALTSERGAAAWRALLPPLAATWAWLRAVFRRGRHRRRAFSHHRGGGYPSTGAVTPHSAPVVPAGPAGHAVHSR